MNEHANNGTILERLSALQEMSIAQLREEFEKHFGKPCLSRDKRKLVKRLAARIQSEAAGEKAGDTIPGPVLTVKFEPKKKGRSKRVAKPEKATAQKKSRVRPLDSRDPRLPKPGTTIERVYKGKKLLVRVLESSFEYQNKPSKSLSALAQRITGSAAINGFLFFRLGDYAKKEKDGK